MLVRMIDSISKFRASSSELRISSGLDHMPADCLWEHLQQQTLPGAVRSPLFILMRKAILMGKWRMQEGVRQGLSSGVHAGDAQHDVPGREPRKHDLELLPRPRPRLPAPHRHLPPRGRGRPAQQQV